MGARESRVLLPKGSLPFPGPRSAQPCSLAAEALSHVAQSAGPNGEGNDEFPLAPHCASGLTRLSAQIHSKLGGGIFNGFVTSSIASKVTHWEYFIIMIKEMTFGPIHTKPLSLEIPPTP